MSQDNSGSILQSPHLQKARCGAPGINLYFDFGGIQWQYADTNGILINQDYRINQWVYRQFDLGQFAGHTFYVVERLHDVASGPGAWDMWYGDMVITSANGTVTPIFAGASGSIIANGCQGPVTDYVGEIKAPSTAPAEPVTPYTRYYTADHLGTTQMELATGGWPVWQGSFAPFGQELDTEPTGMHYKFTGKERDAESGLDNFGDRYYGSTMGRFMSPDPSGLAYADPTNPQSLNLYSIAAAEGLGGGGTAAYQSGQPTNPKRFAAEGAMASTSPASEFLSRTANKLSVPRGRYPSPVGEPGTGMPLSMRTIRNAGRAAGRWLPILGLAADAYAAAQLWNCLGH